MRRLWRDRSGGVAVLAAVGGALACVCAGAAVDGGAVALKVRAVQGAADLAAVSAARDLPKAQRAGEAAAADNLGPGATVRVETGVYAPDATRAPSDRFRPSLDMGQANAARVTLTTQAPVWFGRLLLGRDSVTVTRTATAAVRASEPIAMLSIGSRLAAVDGGLANQLLSGLTGSTVNLTAMDYRALADAKIDLLTFSDALATRAGVRAGDYQALADAQIEAGEALRAVQAASNTALPALDGLVRAAGTTRIHAGEILGLDAAAGQGLRGGLKAGVSALDMAGAVIEIAGAGRQVKLDLGAQTGLADLDVWLAVGERPNRSPWLTVSRGGEPIVRTAQSRLYLEARTSQSLAGLAQVRLPLIVEMAASEARLDRLDCTPEQGVTVGVRPGIARARIGAIDRTRLNDFTRPLAVSPAVLLDVAGIARVAGAANLETASQSWRAERFTRAQIDAENPRTVAATGWTSGAVGSLLGRMQVNVQTLGLGLGLGGLANALSTLLTPLAPVLDRAVDTTLAAAGLSLGQADVTVRGLSCPDRAGAPVLVG